MPAFYLGVSEELEKAGATDMSSMPVNENILPNINSQARWKYVRSKDGLKLSDGNMVYSFGGFPEQFPAEDTRVSRLGDDSTLNFENDLVSKGTAQIHRSSPDNIYMTLADGRQNPTFMLQHERDKEWRYSPSKKFLQKLKAISSAVPEGAESTVQLDPQSLIDAATDTAKTAQEAFMPHLGLDADSIAQIAKDVKNHSSNFLENYAESAAEHPGAMAATNYAALKAIQSLRDLADPSRSTERQLDRSKRSQNELLPLAGATLPVLASMAYKA
jgi:hypothetical protein